MSPAQRKLGAAVMSAGAALVALMLAPGLASSAHAADAASVTASVPAGISGKCLDVNAGSSLNGTRIQLWSCNGTVAQQWTAYSDGSLRALGKCLDVSGGDTANNSRVQLWDCNGTGAQVWRSHDSGLRNPASGRCLDDPASSTVDGTQLALWDCNATGAQRWAIPVAASARTIRVMPLGDSITAGIGSSTGQAYRQVLWDWLAVDRDAVDFVGTQRSGAFDDPDNEGHSGWRIDQVAAVADCVTRKFRPNVITVHLGTNDLGQAYQVSTAPARLAALIDRLTTDAPDASILVATLINSRRGDIEALRGSYNAQVAQLVATSRNAGKHVLLVDMSAVTSADMSDDLHPNDTGYRKMADAFHGAVVSATALGWIGTPVTPGGGCVRDLTTGCSLSMN